MLSAAPGRQERDPLRREERHPAGHGAGVRPRLRQPVLPARGVRGAQQSSGWSAGYIQLTINILNLRICHNVLITDVLNICVYYCCWLPQMCPI